MKKKVFIVLLLLILIGLGAYLYRYQSRPILDNTIPSQADAIVRIDLRQIEKHMLHDVILNPLAYIQSSKKQDTLTAPSDTHPSESPQTSFRDLPSALTLPKDIFLFRNQSDSLWYSSLIEIKDKERLEQILSDLGCRKDRQNHPVRYRKGPIQLYITDKGLRICYGSSTMLPEVTSYLKDDSPLYRSLIENQSDIRYVDRSGNDLDIHLESGALLLSGTYDVDFLRPSKEVVHTSGIASISSTIDIGTFFDLIPLTDREKFFQFTKLNVDSISQFFDGNILGSFHGYTQSLDTIITYDYDDDFNKVEVKKVEEINTPNFSFNLGSKKKGIEYLYRQKAIVEQDGKQVLALMPLATTFVEYNNNTLHLFTDGRLHTKQSTHKFNGHIDLDALRQSVTMTNLILKPIQHISLKIDAENSVAGKVVFSENRCPVAVCFR